MADNANALSSNTSSTFDNAWQFAEQYFNPFKIAQATSGAQFMAGSIPAEMASKITGNAINWDTIKHDAIWILAALMLILIGVFLVIGIDNTINVVSTSGKVAAVAAG